MQVARFANRWSRAGISIALFATATTVGVGGAAAQGDAPAGNNGTVKVDEYDMDDGTANDPHVACGFSITFFGYDAGDQTASILLDPASPTDGGEPLTVTTSWHVDERTGGNQLDDNVQITPEQVAAMVDGIDPSPLQGYHVAVTVNVTGSQGSDVKHKVFWIEPCLVVDDATEDTTPQDAVNEDTATPQDAANEAADTEFAGGSSHDDAFVAAATAAVGAGASAEASEMYAAAAVLAAGYIAPAAPAVALAVASSSTG
jgi:hypothetical protein